jgi:hypothetical protein
MQPRFRSLWERYCRGVQAIVYVVDAADHDAIQVGKTATAAGAAVDAADHDALKMGGLPRWQQQQQEQRQQQQQHQRNWQSRSKTCRSSVAGSGAVVALAVSCGIR